MRREILKRLHVIEDHIHQLAADQPVLTDLQRAEGIICVLAEGGPVADQVRELLDRARARMQQAKGGRNA